MGTVSRPRRRAKLTQAEIDSLKADLRHRLELRAIMSENSHDVLSLEFNVNPRSIMRLERRGPVVTGNTKLPLSTMKALFRRRQMYWSARKMHDEVFSRKFIMERYNIGTETLQRWARVVLDERETERRAGTQQRQVDEDFRTEKVAA